MKQKITLAIDKPCSEKFDNFKTTKLGGFCGSCQKEVIDFTQMTDKEVLDYFTTNQKKSCGRFNDSQLKVYSAVIPSKRTFNFKKIGIGLISFSLLSLLSINKSQAQTNPTVITEKSENTENKQTTTTDNEEITITGNVSCADGSLPGATVQIKGTNIGTSTDIEGDFSLVIPHRDVVLVISFVGFDRQEVKVTDNTPQNIIFEMQEYELMGEVTVSEVYQSKQTVWQKFKGLFR